MKLPISMLNHSPKSVPGSPPFLPTSATNDDDNYPTTPENFFEETIIPESPERQTPDMSLNNSLMHSDQASSFLGNRIPENKERSTRASHKLFCRFVAETYCGCEANTVPERCDCRYEMHCSHVTLLLLVRLKVFTDNRYGFLKLVHTDWSDEELKRVRFYLIEFVVNYRSLKNG